MEGLLAIEDESRRGGTAAWAVLDEAFFARKIAHDEILVAIGDGVLGYLAWTRLWRLPWIEFVRVLEENRREGVGTALARALEDDLRAGGGHVLVSSSTGTDEDAIEWHRAMGYADGGRIEWRIWGRGIPREVLHYKEL